ncbi:MAG TPA: hypothetical protein VHE80_05405 [Acidimicrobiales bacterium]|nr:hypothetical protein [Acidimicrobiales bacterium]
MIYLIVILIVLVVFAVVYGILSQIGFLEPPGGSSSSSSSSYSGGYSPGGRTGTATGFRIPHFGELPEGCLFAVILASFVWFVAWAIVLVLALRIIRSPLG